MFSGWTTSMGDGSTSQVSLNLQAYTKQLKHHTQKYQKIIRAEYKRPLSLLVRCFRELALLMKTQIRKDHGRQCGSLGDDCCQLNLSYH